MFFSLNNVISFHTLAIQVYVCFGSELTIVSGRPGFVAECCDNTDLFLRRLCYPTKKNNNLLPYKPCKQTTTPHTLTQQVDRKSLDPTFAYVQVTFVQPYFSEDERAHKVTYFEKQHNVRNFCYETPFTPAGKARGSIDQQWKRKTICTSQFCILCAKTFAKISERVRP